MSRNLKPPALAGGEFTQPLGRAQLVCCYLGHGLQAGVPKGTEPPTRLTPLPRGDVLLLRGLLWPDRQPPGVVYRDCWIDFETVSLT